MKSRVIAGIIAALLLSIVAGVCCAESIRSLPAEEWMAVSFGPNKVGYVHISFSMDKLNGKDLYREDSSAVMRLRVDGIHSMEAHANCMLKVGTDFLPISGSGESLVKCLDPADPNKEVTHTFATQVQYGHGGTVTVKTTTDGKSSEEKHPIPEDIDLKEACMYEFRVKTPGLGARIPMFDFLGGSFGIPDESASTDEARVAKVVKREQITVGGKSDYALLLKAGNNSIWENDKGELLKEEYNVGSIVMTMVRVTREEALKDTDAVNPGIYKIYVDHDIPDSAFVRYLDVRLIGMWDKKFIRTDSRQSAVFNPDQNMVEYRINAMPFDPAKSLALPVKDKAYRQWTHPSQGIESSDREIRDLAQKIVGTETSAYMAACKLRAWVYNNIRYDDKVSVPCSALEILKTKAGVCAHHALLFTALARSVGIPTRLVVGPLYAPWLEKLSFAYHAWAECYVGEWVAFDPTGDMDFVNAAHIAMLTGGVETLFDHAEMAGKLRAEIVDYKYVDGYALFSLPHTDGYSFCKISGMWLMFSRVDTTEVLNQLRSLAETAKLPRDSRLLLLCPDRILFRFPVGRIPHIDPCKAHEGSAAGTLIVIGKDGSSKCYPHGIDPTDSLQSIGAAYIANQPTLYIYRIPPAGSILVAIWQAKGAIAMIVDAKTLAQTWVSASSTISSIRTTSDPNGVDMYTGRADGEALIGDYDRALADYDKALDLDPKSAVLHCSRGSVLCRKGEYDRAISDYDKAIEFDPKCADAFFSRGSVFFAKGKVDLAICDYKRYRDLAPASEAYYINIANQRIKDYDGK
jgi:hypothetical protein